MRFLPDTRGLPRAYWFLFAGAFANKVGGFVILLLAFYLRTERHFSVETAGSIVAVWGAGTFVSAPVGGHLADRIGRRATMILSQLVGAAALIHLGFARAPLHVAIGAFLVGLSCDAFRPAMSAAVADLVPPDDRRRAYALNYWAINMAFAVAALLAGVLANINYWICFVADAATSVVFAIVIAIGVPETRPEAPPPREGDAPDRGAIAAYGDRVFMTFIAVAFVTNLIFAQGWAPLPLDMAAHGIDAATFGKLLAVNGLLIVLLQPFFTDLLAGVASERALAAAAVLIGIGMGVNAFARTPLTYALGIVVWTFGELSMAPVAPTVVAGLAPAHRRGAYQGAYQVTWGGSSFLAPLVGSAVLGRFGGATLWVGCFLGGLAGAAGHLAIGVQVRRRIAAIKHLTA